jgi:hypothetical protein
VSKIQFEDKSYIEITKSTSPGKIILTIAARSEKNTAAVVAHSVEITEEQLKELTKLS